MKKIYKLLIILVITILGSIIVCNKYKKTEYSIFSWEIQNLNKQNLDNIVENLNKLDISTIYQNIDNLSNKDIEKFVRTLKDNNINTYALSGDPSWYDNDKIVNQYLNKIDEYNKHVKNRYKIKGVVLDIEPWTLYKDWNRMSYANNMVKIYEYAKKLGLKTTIIIPTWIEPSDLEIIIKNCDTVAIMNYNIDFPIENIKEEIYIAKKYKKNVEIIAETQPINEKYGVEENTTYYYKGYKALLSDWYEIRTRYKYSKMSFSYHDYKNIKTFIDLEE